jgi:hypothetical protein
MICLKLSQILTASYKSHALTWLDLKGRGTDAALYPSRAMTESGV